jgi:hypothetical protein
MSGGKARPGKSSKNTCQPHWPHKSDTGATSPWKSKIAHDALSEELRKVGERRRRPRGFGALGMEELSR